MREFTSFLAPLMRAYVSYQKASGRWNESSYEVMMTLFDRHCKKNYPNASELSQEMVSSWCGKRETETNNSCRSRIYPVVSFIRYLRKRGLTTVMTPVIPRKEPRVWREDVDLKHGVLNIQYSKGHAQHYVVLHDSMLSLMGQYDAVISKQYASRTYFFPARNGGFHKRAWVQKNFRQMWSRYNSGRATAYELRHNYAIENINHWTGEGFGFNEKLLYLSKSMGHSVLEDTKYYYSLVPGLADVLEAQTDEDAVIPEVDYENL
jgi:hypothetical protein